MRQLNLIFQGGGVKGIAYAGALQSLPRDYRLRGVGGTSAGAIVAALLATGKRDKRLKEILEDPDLFRLLAKEEADRYARIRAMFAQQQELLGMLKDAAAIWPSLNGGWMDRIGALSSVKEFKHKYSAQLAGLESFAKDLLACWQAKGAHSSRELRKWLDRVLGKATFAEIEEEGYDLRIVAADVGIRKYLIFNSEDHSGELIARAVHASVSVPVFFRPLEASDGQCFVDGGLVSNFPSFLFDKSPFPTVGFRLKEAGVQTREPIEPFDYLLSLLETMFAAHDEHRERNQRFQSYTIETPEDIPFDKFSLDKKDVERLFLRGKSVGDSVPWGHDDHSSTKELVRFFDPLANRVLANALEQAESLIHEHLDEKNYVDKIDQKTVLQVRISRQWTSSYERRDTIRVSGSKPLILQRVRLSSDAKVGRNLSLAHTNPSCEELTDGVERPLVYLPAYNKEDEKGFVVFFSPPISEGDSGPRTIRSRMTLDKEFERTMGRGDRDSIRLVVIRRAKEHKSHATIKVLIPANFKNLKSDPKPTSIDMVPLEGEDHMCYQWNFTRERLEGNFEMAISLWPA